MYPISRILALAVTAVLGAAAASVAHAASSEQSSGATSLSTDRGCYLVGQKVELRGSGFAPDRTYVVTINGVYIGKSTSGPDGEFTVPIHPGGLPAGSAQNIDRVQVSDGTTTAQTVFTLTRPPGARILTNGGNPSTISGRFQIWGFSLRGTPRHVYVHYVSPSGHVQKSIALGHTVGQCGSLRTSPRRLFPFSVSPGTWTLQFDTKRSYARHPAAPVTRVSVRVSG